MKFILDAHVPPSLRDAFFLKGHEAIHTKDLPLKNDTSDDEIIEFSIKNKYYQTNTPITHGSSGGPLFNMKGEIIGITTIALGKGNLNFAINIKLLKLDRYK